MFNLPPKNSPSSFAVSDFTEISTENKMFGVGNTVLAFAWR